MIELLLPVLAAKVAVVGFVAGAAIITTAVGVFLFVKTTLDRAERDRQLQRLREEHRDGGETPPT